MAGALIGALRVSLSAETTAFEAGMSRAQAVAKKTAANINKPFDTVGKTIERTALSLAEVLTLAAVYRAGKAALEYAGHLGELADTLGLTTKDLQTFSYAAGQVGISQEELQTGIQKLTISMGQAESGAKKQINAFNAIGISVDDLKNKTSGDIFREIADKLQTVGDRSQRAAVEVALFGKAGAKLDNLLSGSQGRLDDLSDAAERLGIVLSDEQIRKADQTADKIAALQTVLKAQIASEVADNADAILGLANALGRLVHSIGDSIKGWKILRAEFSEPITWHDLFGGGGGVLGAMERGAQRVRTADTWAAIRAATAGFGKSTSATGGDIGNFLAPSRSGGSHSAKKDDLERKQLDALQKAYDFQKSDLEAQKDILGAKKDLSEDYIEQTTLSIQILNLERQQYQADLDNQVAQNRITKGKEGISQAQADHLLAQYDITDGLKRQKVLQDEEEQRQRDVGELEDHILDRQKDYLGKLADLATTQADRRKIQLEILELEYQEKKQVLDRIIANSKNAKEVEDARRDLLDLQKNHAADKQGVINSTRNPIEEWAASVPKSAAEINEALQSIEAKGLDGLADALTGVLRGTESLKSAFHNLAASVLADLIQMTIKMLLFKALTAAFGGAVGGTTSVPVAGARASGGPVLGGKAYLIGEKGPELFMPKMSGAIIPNTRVRAANDSMPGGGAVTLNFHNDFRGADPSAVASINARLNQMQAELPGTIVSTMNDARERFLWRGK
jgi:hypothetical protein